MEKIEPIPIGDELVGHLLNVAREIVEKVTNCWLVTVSLSGEGNTRIVAPIPGIPGERDWTVWVLTSAASRKVSEIENDSRVTLGYQYDPDSAYVALGGSAIIINDRANISERWKASWNNVFQGGDEDPDAVFLRVEVERIELFSIARKVAPAPFSKRSASIARDATGSWRVC